MRRIVVSEFSSLDGVMEDPGGAEGWRHGGWTFAFNDPEGMKCRASEDLVDVKPLPSGSLILTYRRP